MHCPGDTIAAVSTPQGDGGIGIVRISGPSALSVASQIFRGRGGCDLEDAPPWQLILGIAADPGSDEPIDEVLAVRMPAGRSYTGETTVEIQAHGGRLVIDAVLGAALRAGARLAAPGEFTKRAFLSGRLDLTQAEAVAQLIGAESESARRLAMLHLQGGLADVIRKIHGRLLDLIAAAETALDFDEGESADPSMKEVKAVVDDIKRLLAPGQLGRAPGQGIKVVIAGRTNTGKSSIFNMLSSHERSIVAPSPGTTRDYIEERVPVGGVMITLVDTAGLRSSNDPVEAEGMLRSRRMVSEADLLLLLLDGSVPVHEEELQFVEELSHRLPIILVNKSDLALRIDLEALKARAGRSPIFLVSARTGDGCQCFRDALAGRCLELARTEDIASPAPNSRHREALERAAMHLESAMELDLLQTLDQMVTDLRSASAAIGEITGETATEEILERIFSRFCIGK
jgi:tRNA modification GTPase